MAGRRTGWLVGGAATIALLAGAAAVWGADAFEGGRAAERARAVNEALNGGPRSDWVAAIAATRHFARTPADADAPAGALLLRSLADPRPATRPPGTVEDAFRLMEAGATRRPARDAPIIESFLRYGVAEPRSDKVVIPPDPPVAACWARVEARAEKPQACVALRRSARGAPLVGTAAGPR